MTSARYAATYLDERDGRPVIQRVFRESQGFVVRSAPVEHGRVLSVVAEHPAALWDERELRDLHGIVFEGHEPHRPLLDHDAPLDAWTTPVHGADVYDVAVGPTHAGVIESGHFRFHVVGELVLHLDLRMFYKRRGIEQLVRGRTLDDALELVGRACAGCHVANSVAFADACEITLGLAPTTGLAQTRTLLLELERVWNHCNDIAAICAGVGYAIGNMAFASLKERAQRLCQELTGHRFLFGTIAIAESTLTITSAQRDTARSTLAAIRGDAKRAWREILHSPSVDDRCRNIGVLDHGIAELLGAVGPVARASGVAHDARSGSSRLHYPGFEPARLLRAAGDVASRLELRALELDASLGLLDDLLGGSIEPADCTKAAAGERVGISQVESPRGETTCIVDQRDGSVRTMRLRTSSYANWPVFAAAVPGNLLPDFPLINKSFELCYACCDR